MPSVGNQTDSHQPLRTSILQTKQNPNNMLHPFSSSTTYLLDLLHTLLWNNNNNNKSHSQTPWKTKKLETPIYKMRPNSVSPTRPLPPPKALSATAPIILIMCSSKNTLRKRSFNKTLRPNLLCRITPVPASNNINNNKRQTGHQEKQISKHWRGRGISVAYNFFQSSFSFLVITKIVFRFSYAIRLLLRVSVRLHARPQEARETHRERLPTRYERREERESVCVRESFFRAHVVESFFLI